MSRAGGRHILASSSDWSLSALPDLPPAYKREREAGQVYAHTCTLTSSYLCIGHLFVEYLHLGIDIVSLLVLIQRAVVPHEMAEGWMELSDIVCSPNPCLFLTVRRQAVATMRVTCSYNEHILWDGLEEKKGLL